MEFFSPPQTLIFQKRKKSAKIYSTEEEEFKDIYIQE